MLTVCILKENKEEEDLAHIEDGINSSGKESKSTEDRARKTKKNRNEGHTFEN